MIRLRNSVQSKFLNFSFLASTVLVVLGSLYGAIGLYADGSWFLLQILNREGYWLFDPPRLFSQIINQTPLVISIGLGVNDLSALIRIHTFGLVVVPVILWVWAFFNLRNSRFEALVPLAFSVTFLTTGFFAISEYNVAFALHVWVISFLLRDKLSKWQKGLLAFALVMSVAAYESAVFIAPLVATLTIVRTLRPGFLGFDAPVLTKKQALGALVTTASSFLLAVFSVLFPRDPINLGNAGTGLLYSFGGAFIQVAVLLLLTYGLLIFSRNRNIRAAGLGISAAVFMILAIQESFSVTPSENYQARVAATLLLGAAVVLVCWGEYQKANTEKAGVGARNTAIACVVLVFSVSFLNTTLEHSRWISKFEELVNISTRSYMAVQEVFTDQEIARFGWSWAYPALSKVLSTDDSNTLIRDKNTTDFAKFVFESSKSVSLHSRYLKTRRLFEPIPSTGVSVTTLLENATGDFQ